MKNLERNHSLLWTLLVVATVCFSYCGKISYDVTIPQQSVQESLDKKFPITKKYAEITDVTLSNPVLNLGDNRDRLTISLNTKIKQSQTGAQLSDGRIVFSSGLNFNDSTGEFLMEKVTVDSVLFGLGNINDQMKSGITDFIRSQIQENIEGITFYRLDPQNSSTPMAKRLISKVYIHDNNIVVTLTLNK